MDREQPGREEFIQLLREPEDRDARGYIIPSDQPDFLTATKFVEALLENGVTVHRATRAFEVAGEQYPAGSYVVQSAQAFRPHVLDMFEPQDHPDDIPYPGAAPTPPYDNAGWTLAYQMGVEFDRVLEGLDGPFEPIEGFHLAPPPGRITGSGNAGYLLSAAVNDAFVAVNRLLAGDRAVYRLAEPWRTGGREYSAGTFYIPASGGVRPMLETLAREKGLTFEVTGSRPGDRALRLRPVRIGLWDRYGGSMPSGWTRWLFEQFEFPYEVVYAPRLNEGSLEEAFDILVFVDGAIPSPGARDFRRDDDDDPLDGIPAEYHDRIGSITADTTIPQLRAFLEAGGTIMTIGSSTNLAEHLELPLEEAPARDGRRLGREEFYVPGSLLRARVDATQPVAWGMPEHADFMFDNSPSFSLGDGAAEQGLTPIAWFDSATPLRSGWAWGQQHLEGAVAAVQADIGEGRLYLFGPEITFRAQPHGTFKLLFNAIHTSVAEPARIR